MGVADFGGKADAVDLRPRRLDEVYLEAVDCDADPERECLQIVTGPTGQVVVHGLFGPYFEYPAWYGQHGPIETLLFADGPVSMVAGQPATETWSGDEGLLGRAETKQQQELAARAPGLAEVALKHAHPAG